MGVFLETERLILRFWTDAGRDPFARLNADPRVMEFMPHPLSRAESDAAFDRIQAHFLKYGFGLFAAVLNSRMPGLGEFSQARDPDSEARARQAVAGPFQPPASDGSVPIGFIGLSVPSFEAHFTPCVEIGWRLAAEDWNRGLATEGARAVVRYAFEVLRLDELVSFTVPANAGSRRVMEKLGMSHDPEDDFDHPGLPILSNTSGYARRRAYAETDVGPYRNFRCPTPFSGVREMPHFLNCSAMLGWIFKAAAMSTSEAA